MSQKLNVFVSSVQKELEDERVIVQNLLNTDTFLSAHCAPVLYEFEPASPDKLDEVGAGHKARTRSFIRVMSWRPKPEPELSDNRQMKTRNRQMPLRSRPGLNRQLIVRLSPIIVRLEPVAYSGCGVAVPTSACAKRRIMTLIVGTNPITTVPTINSLTLPHA